MKLVKHVPNSITCLNLLCGVIGIAAAFEGKLVYASYLIFLACLFDFFDGFAARLLKASSPIGKDLDSLADVVSFGVLPGIIVYKLVEGALLPNSLSEEIICRLPFIIIVISAVRLAIFNNDTRQTSSFIGLPTPANAIFFASIPLILDSQESSGFTDYMQMMFSNINILIGLSLLMSYLLVSPIPLFALKFKSFGFSENLVKYSFLIFSLLLLILFHYTAIPFIILLYIVVSIFYRDNR